MAMETEQQKMQTVLLSGSLARLFGREHRVTTSGGFRDVMGYFKQFPGFEKYMLKRRQGAEVCAFQWQRNIGEEGIPKPWARM